MAITFEELNLSAPDGSIIGIITDQPWADERVLLHPFSTADAVTRALGISKVIARRRAGEAIVMVTHDESLLERCADEIWWLRDGKLAARGDPAEVLPAYRRYVAQTLREMRE